jgi:hypothetical protein
MTSGAAPAATSPVRSSSKFFVVRRHGVTSGLDNHEQGVSMRQLLVIFPIITLSGCMLLAEDELEDSRGGKRTLTINWKVKQPGGADAPCPPGFAHLVLASTTVEQSGQDWRIVPCATSGTEVVEVYTSGERKFHMEGDDATVYTESFTENYIETMFITDPTGSIERARSLPIRLKMYRDQTIDIEIYPDGGHFLQSWQLWSDLTNSRAFTCEAVAVDEIELRYRLFTFDGEPEAPTKTVRWPCMQRFEDFYISDNASGQGFVPELAPESYVGSLIALRNGVEVGRNDEVNFMIMTGGKLSEWEEEIRVKDR